MGRAAEQATRSWTPSARGSSGVGGRATRLLPQSGPHPALPAVPATGRMPPIDASQGGPARGAPRVGEHSLGERLPRVDGRARPAATQLESWSRGSLGPLDGPVRGWLLGAQLRSPSRTSCPMTHLRERAAPGFSGVAWRFAPSDWRVHAVGVGSASEDPPDGDGSQSGGKPHRSARRQSSSFLGESLLLWPGFWILLRMAAALAIPILSLFRTGRNCRDGRT